MNKIDNKKSYGWLKKNLLPNFLLENYSPYKCNVSFNKENYNLKGRIWHLKNLIKTCINLKRIPFPSPIQCNNCLFDTRLPNIYIHKDGLCNMCHTYKEKFDGEILKNEINNFLLRKREEESEYDAIIAYSGGKDSTVSLVLAVTVYKLKVMAVLVDNGFIPQEVIDNGKRICENLNVPLRVEKAEFATKLNELYEKNFTTGYPCNFCGILFHDVITNICVQEKINRVITGRNWWRMLDPYFSAIKTIQSVGSDMKIDFLSLPFALQLKENDELPYLQQVGWIKVKSIYGHSTNCLVPGFVEKIAFDNIGYHPELNLVSREVICGFLTKEEGLRKISSVNDLTEELKEILVEKLNSAK